MEIAYFDLMDQLVGEKAIFPTRNELVRLAVREKIIKEFKTIKANKGNAEV